MHTYIHTKTDTLSHIPETRVVYSREFRRTDKYRRLSSATSSRVS